MSRRDLPDFRAGAVLSPCVGVVETPRAERFDAARGTFEEFLALARGSDLAETARFYLAQSLYHLGQYERAGEVYEAITRNRKSPLAADAAFERALALYQAKTYAQAAKAFRQVTQRFGDSPRAGKARLYEGICYLLADDADKAIPCLRDMTEDAEAQYWLGKAYLKTGRPAEARQAFERAQVADAAGPRAADALRQRGQMYDHCLAAMLLAESYSMTGEERLAEPIRQAVAFTLRAQNPGLGWRYAPRADNDTSVLGWALMALKSAEIAGFAVPRSAYRGSAHWLDRVRKGKHGGLFEYQPGRNLSPAMTAEGLFSEMLIDYDPASPRTREAVRYILDHEPRYVPQSKDRTNLYYWYYATLALHQLGGPEWDQWNRMVREALVASQRTDGPWAGSWDTRTRWGQYGGRVYTTAMAALTLEVYYRYLPFYDLRLGE